MAPTSSDRFITVGIDVGGARKGFHAVALANGAYAGQLATGDAGDLAHWCCSVVRASVIAIDAPCRWSTDGRSRPCERELMRKRIWCFSSPTHQKALDHPTNYYGWMLQGEALYAALESGPPQDAYPLMCALPIAGQRCCFETFPHAITWHLRGGRAQAAQKCAQRRELLVQAGLDPAPFTSIDWIDAALCALAAHHAASGGDCVAYGAPESGWTWCLVGPRPAVIPWARGAAFPAAGRLDHRARGCHGRRDERSRPGGRLAGAGHLPGAARAPRRPHPYADL